MVIRFHELPVTVLTLDVRLNGLGALVVCDVESWFEPLGRKVVVNIFIRTHHVRSFPASHWANEDRIGFIRVTYKNVLHTAHGLYRESAGKVGINDPRLPIC